MNLLCSMWHLNYRARFELKFSSFTFPIFLWVGGWGYYLYYYTMTPMDYRWGTVGRGIFTHTKLISIWVWPVDELIFKVKFKASFYEDFFFNHGSQREFQLHFNIWDGRSDMETFKLIPKFIQTGTYIRPWYKYKYFILKVSALI